MYKHKRGAILKAKKFIFFSVAVIVFVITITINCYAEERISNVNVFSVTERENMLNFNMDTLAPTAHFGWINQTGSSPEQRYERGLAGYVLINSSDTNSATFTSSLKSPIDAYSYRNLSFALNISCENDQDITQDCRFILTLYSGNESIQLEGTVKSGGWNVIDFNVGSWKHRKNITGIIVNIIAKDENIALTNIDFSGPYVTKEAAPKSPNFMSYELSSSGAEIEIVGRGSADEYIRTTLKAQRTSINGDVYVPYSEDKLNAVRIVVSNYSLLDEMTFYYTYLDASLGKYVSDSKTISLEQTERPRSYFIHTGNVTLISDFSLILDSKSEGIFAIHSIEPISFYEGYTDELYGEISDCKVSSDKKLLNIEGNVFHNFLIGHDNYTLACYQLRTGESLEFLIQNGAKPIATQKMSSKFSFELKLSKLGEYALISKYAIAAISDEGEYFLLCAPTSVKGKFSSAETSSGRTNIKGLQYEKISAMVDGSVGSAVIDVYLDKLTNSTNSGHLYATKDTFIYFNADYIAELDKKIKNLYSADCKVYLRLLISSDADSLLLPYVNTEGMEKDTSLLAVNISSHEAERNFFATVDYIAGRYSDITYGKISGLILGKSLDMMNEYNYSGDKYLADYAATVAGALEIMARTAVSSIPGIEIILPISDARTEKNGFDTELFLLSVCQYLDMGGGLEFSLMLESSHAPYSISEKRIKTGHKLTSADEESNYYCTDNIYVFERILDHLASVSKSSPRSYIYHWTPDITELGEGLSTAYIYNYYSIMFSEKASSFVISLPNSAVGQKAADSLSYLIKYVDTERNKDGSISLFALNVLGAESWDALIDGYDAEKITYRAFYEAESLEEVPPTVTGRYSLWDFSSAFGALGWFEGSNCNSVYVDATAPGGKALCASISGKITDEDGYSDVVYRYEYTDDLSLMPYIKFQFDIDDGDEGALYEIVVIIGGDGHRIETSKQVRGSQADSIIVCTTDCKELAKMEYLRFCVRRIYDEEIDIDSDFKLYLKKVTAYSEKYDDAAFERAIESSRATAKNTSAVNAEETPTKTRYEFVIAIAIVIALSVAMVAFYERKQK